MRQPAVAPTAPWVPPRYDPADAHAVRAVAAGTASRDQQQRAMRWIIENAAGTYQDTHFPSDADRCFANGKRWVGLRLVTLINMPADVLAKMQGAKDVRQRGDG